MYFIPKEIKNEQDNDVIDYSVFESVDELKKAFSKRIVVEDKNDDEKEDKEDNDEAPEANKETGDEASQDKDVDKEELPKKELSVVYADKDAEPKCIFKYIIMFTNSKDPKENKTLKNVIEAVEPFKDTKLLLLYPDEMHFETDEDDNMLTIGDDDTTIEFDDTYNNTNTLVIARLGIQKEEECKTAIKMLQDKGFLVLNPVRASELACNKYDSAVLFKKCEIPQPNFCLMKKDILYDEKDFNAAMKEVDSKWSKDTDKNAELNFVIKILDGHGGTGVAMIDGKKLIAMLQMIFAIDPERRLIIQRKENGDGGDIRVHVLTLRNKQVILGAMKRVKIGGDFRSNVSLGATAEPVELTPEQEEIALKTAKISGLPWCAVDIMPLVKGSNKELGDNVVLEINASPGTDGISDVLDFNLVTLLLNELSDPKEFCLQQSTAGFIETVSVDFGKGEFDVLAKLDTGNGSKASHIEVGKLDINDGKASFSINGQKYKLDIIDESKAVTGTQVNKRPVVMLKSLKLGNRCVIDLPVALVEHRTGKSTNMLINRNALTCLSYAVSPFQTHVLTPEMEKMKII